MEEIVVKTEGTEEILLFYVDETGSEHSLVTTVDNIDQHHGIQVQDTGIIMETVESSDIVIEDNDGDIDLNDTQFNTKDRWTEEETKRMLIFFIDNKETFVKGTTKKKHLWSVACKTMITSKNAVACEMKLRNMKQKYIQLRMDQRKGNISHNWVYFDLCHQAFFDDAFVKATLNAIHPVATFQQDQRVVTQIQKPNDNGIMIIKKTDSTRSISDEKVDTMLQLYLNQKNRMKNVPKEMWQKGVWETVALELGEGDAEFWHRRFLNFKQHYIRMIDKRNDCGASSVHWPYLKYFDEIFKDDDEFQRKYVTNQSVTTCITVNTDMTPVESQEPPWDGTEITVLVKYYFDCFHEFEDPTIPDIFLWNEVGRLLDRNADLCRLKYEQLKKEHLDNHNDGTYDLKMRVPLSILFDNIISKEVEVELAKESKKPSAWQAELWKTNEIDELVQFFYENVAMLSDPMCYNVCWARLSRKLNRSVLSCKKQWEDLKSLYQSILSDKKENPDMEIDWRYIELFDRIFDYGMNQALLDGFDNIKTDNETKLNVKKVNIKMDSDQSLSDSDVNGLDEDYSDDGRSLRSKRKGGEAKAFKILEFYQKNKDKFSTSNRRKSAIWEAIARQVKMTPTQCAHRFRNLKQVYMAYLHRECKTPEKPIVWPYYNLCKKVFGYKALKSKILKKESTEADYEFREWSPKEIKTLIAFYSQNFDYVNKNVQNEECWTQLAEDLGKSEIACRDKFLELRKSYRKLKTMLTRNPRTKVSWKYFNMFDEIYSQPESVAEDTFEIEYNDNNYEEIAADEESTHKIQEGEDDDIQCIIVIPEGEDLSEALMNGKHYPVTLEHIEPMEVDNDLEATKPLPKKWTKRNKKRLLILYLNYLRSHRNQVINASEMWLEISSKIPNKTPLSCKKIFAKLKKNRLSIDNIDEVKRRTPYYAVLEKILAMDPKFTKRNLNKDGSLKKAAGSSDVPLPKPKVKEILEYYLEHLEEFLSPRYEKKKVWLELANKVDEPMMKVYNKVMFLKNIYSKKDENAAEEIPNEELLQKIFDKQKQIKNQIATEKQATPKEVANGDANETLWDDDETEKLLMWYLENLDKFKNPKFVRSYLWKEAAEILSKSPLGCSKKMAEIRTQYRTMVRETPNVLKDWKFSELCQKIYGTGKRHDSTNENALEAT